MDRTDRREGKEKSKEILQWILVTTQKEIYGDFAAQGDFGNSTQPQYDYEENNRYDEEAQRVLRITTILKFFNRYRITVAGSLNMPLEELEEKYQLARKFMIRRLIQERTMAQKKEAEKQTCTIEEITDDQDRKIPWYYRLIPCCDSTPRPKVMKQKKKKGNTGRVFGRIQKLFNP